MRLLLDTNNVDIYSVRLSLESAIERVQVFLCQWTRVLRSSNLENQYLSKNEFLYSGVGRRPVTRIRLSQPNGIMVSVCTRVAGGRGKLYARLTVGARVHVLMTLKDGP